MGLSFALLGPLQVLRDAESVPLGGPKQRAVLAVLLLAAERVVPIRSLVDAVWDGDPGDKAEATLQVHMSGLRRALGPDGATIATRPPGYLLAVEAGRIDLGRFRSLREQGRAAAVQADHELAAGCYAEALALWRGPALSDLSALQFARDAAVGLEEERLVVLERRIDADLARGQAPELVSELTLLTRQHPLRESTWARFVLALYRSGRQAEALASYAELSRALRDELGLEPTAELQTLQRRVLEQDRTLGAGASPVELRSTVRVKPAEGPHGVLVHQGRLLELHGGRVTIGRHPDCDVTLDDPLVSRQHAEVVHLSGELTLVDLRSTNGTMVNGVAVVQHPLRHGDEVSIGHAVLRFQTR